MLYDHINMDDAFRERLKNYEQAPSPHVWDKIEYSLDSRKKRNGWNIVQIAATFLIFMAVGALVIIQNFSFYKNHSTYLTLDNINNNTEKTQTGKFAATRENRTPEFAAKHKKAEEAGLTLAEFSGDESITNREIPHYEEFAVLEQANPIFTGLPQHRPANENHTFEKNNTYTSSDHESWPQSRPTLAMNTHKEERLTLGGSLSPTVSYRNTRSGKEITPSMHERSLIAYSGGFNIGYKITERLKMRTGVYYSQMGQTLNNVEITADSYVRIGADPVVHLNGSLGVNELSTNELTKEGDGGGIMIPSRPSSGDVEINALRHREFTVENALIQRMDFVKVPFLFEYKVIDKNVSLSLINGVNTNILINEGIYMQNDMEANKVGSTKNLNRINYSATVGLEVDYEINKNIHLTMQPAMDYFISSFNGADGKTFPYSVGLFTGLSVSF